MNDNKKASSTISDPIIDMIEQYGGMALTDDFVAHQVSLSDVVKNDMKRSLDWDEDTVHAKLWGIIQSGLDRNGRYRERPIEESAQDPHQKYSRVYVESQCLLTEWLAIYRAIRVHFGMLRKRKAAA